MAPWGRAFEVPQKKKVVPTNDPPRQRVSVMDRIANAPILKRRGSAYTPPRSTAMSVMSLIEHMLPHEDRVYIRINYNTMETCTLKSDLSSYSFIVKCQLVSVTIGIILAVIYSELVQLNAFIIPETAKRFNYAMWITAAFDAAFHVVKYRTQKRIMAVAAPLIATRQRKRFLMYLLSSIMCLTVPMPWADPALIFSCYFTNVAQPCAITINTFVTIWYIFYRFSYIVYLAITISIWNQSTRLRVFSKFAKVTLGTGFHVRSILYQNPAKFLVPICFGYFTIISICEMILERRFLQTCADGNGNLFCGLPVMLWFHFVTATSTGYGDFAPITTVGRAFAITSMIFGLLVAAVLVAITSQQIQLKRGEVMLIHTMQEHDQFDAVCDRAVRVLQRWARYWIIKKDQEHFSVIEEKRIDASRAYVQWRSEEERYRSTRLANNFSMQPMVERMDASMNQMMEEMRYLRVDMLSAMRSRRGSLERSDSSSTPVLPILKESLSHRGSIIQHTAPLQDNLVATTSTSATATNPSSRITESFRVRVDNSINNALAGNQRIGSFSAGSYASKLRCSKLL